jgi:hypothetical protein
MQPTESWPRRRPAGDGWAWEAKWEACLFLYRDADAAAARQTAGALAEKMCWYNRNSFGERVKEAEARAAGAPAPRAATEPGRWPSCESAGPFLLAASTDTIVEFGAHGLAWRNRNPLMWRKRLRDLIACSLRSRGQRIALTVLVFCVVNGLWAIAGGWSISPGGERYIFICDRFRESGVYSYRGYLVLAVRHFTLGMAGSPRHPVSPTPVRQHIPWHFDAKMHIGPPWYAERSWNGIVDRPSIVLPGVFVNWDPDRGGEFYNRGIAVHWVLLALLSSAPTVAFLVGRRRRISAGLCGVCGYDMRATPNRCPECGTECLCPKN